MIIWKVAHNACLENEYDRCGAMRYAGSLKAAVALVPILEEHARIYVNQDFESDEFVITIWKLVTVPQHSPRETLVACLNGRACYSRQILHTSIEYSSAQPTVRVS